MVRTTFQAGAAAAAAALIVALLPACGRAQAPAQAIKHTAPREIRYCTSCATVQSVQAEGAGAGAKQHVMVIRFDDGSTRSFSYANDPGFRVGEKVKENSGVVVRDVAEKISP